MIFGPSAGFMLQYNEILTKKDPSGFSNLICLVLIIANILRVFWWFIDPALNMTVIIAAVVMLVS